MDSWECKSDPITNHWTVTCSWSLATIDWQISFVVYVSTIMYNVYISIYHNKYHIWNLIKTKFSLWSLYGLNFVKSWFNVVYILCFVQFHSVAYRRLYFCSGPYLILPTIEWQIKYSYANMILGKHWLTDKLRAVCQYNYVQRIYLYLS